HTSSKRDGSSDVCSSDLIRAHVDRTRTIKDLPQPLRSQGQMLIARDQGLLWDQTSPFPMQLLLDDKRMVQVINGQPPQIITAENNPQMFQFNHLLRALFQADRKVLEQNFRVEFADKGEGRWKIGRASCRERATIGERRDVVT